MLRVGSLLHQDRRKETLPPLPSGAFLPRRLGNKPGEFSLLLSGAALRLFFTVPLSYEKALHRKDEALFFLRAHSVCFSPVCMDLSSAANSRTGMASSS